MPYNKEFTEEQAVVWYDFFKNETYDNFRNAVKRIIPKKQFMPSIAELKQEITLLKNPVLQLKADEEWENVLRAISKYGYYRGDEGMKSLNPTTAKVVRMLGGWGSICQSTDGDWLRKNFMDLFNTKVENYEEAALLGEPQLTLAELTRIAETKALDHNEQKYNKALSIMADNYPPCELDEEFMDKNIDYCFSNCGVDEEVFKECWDRYIEQSLEGLNE